MSTPSDQQPKELSNELRMFLFVVLMGVILAGSPFVFRKLGLEPPETAKPVSTPNKPAKPQDKPASPAADAVSAQSAPQESQPAGLQASAQESEWTIDTNAYRIVFSNRGAVAKSWMLRKYKDANGKPLQLINQVGAPKVGFPFSYVFRGQGPSTDLNQALWVAKPGADGLSIEYTFSDGNTTAHKTFSFTRDGYLVQYADEVKLGSTPLPHLMQWRAGFGDMAVNNASAHQENIRYELDRGKLVTQSAKDGKGGPARADGQHAFAGIQDQYFTTVFLAPQNTALQMTTFYDDVATPVNSAPEGFPGLAVGSGARNQFGVYVGPKEIDELRKVNPRLEDVIDWGTFGIIAKPIFFLLQFTNSKFAHNYGWAIILVTIAINIATFPLRLASLKSMRKMQSLQPELNKINEKYKGISMSDPKAANKQQEMMDLYKKHGVNPMGGCIPMLIQMPFLWAFYKVLSVAIEMRNANWLWVTDLSQPEHFAIRFLPIIMIASSYLMQRMTPMTGGDPAQQKMMQFMPLMYGFMFWPASSGLVLYWLTSNLVGIFQQWFFNKTSGPVRLAGVSANQGKVINAPRKRA
jgi:YidC/Oxa1 family membrane protein insertase